MNATRTLTARMAVLVAAAGLLLTGCGTKAPDALVRREVAPAVASDVTKPCTRAGRRVDRPTRVGPGRAGRDLRRGGQQDRPERRPERHPARAGREAEQAGPAQGDRSRRVAARHEHRDRPGRVAQDRGADGPVAQAAQRRRRGLLLDQGPRWRHRHQRHLRDVVERGQGHGRRGLPQRPRLPAGPRRRTDDDRQGRAAATSASATSSRTACRGVPRAAAGTSPTA